MKDFLGNDFEVGDHIVYAAMSGRSVTMVHAKVLEFKDNGNVRVQPVDSARWTQHYSRSRYINRATGKGIDPYAAKHHKVKEHWTRRDDATVYTAEEMDRVSRDESGYTGPHWRPSYYDRHAQIRWDKYQNVLTSFTHHAAVWADYVQEVKAGPNPVTLKITKNIVKIADRKDDTV